MPLPLYFRGPEGSLPKRGRMFGGNARHLDRRPMRTYPCTVAQVCTKRSRSPKAAARCCAPIDGLLSPELFKSLGDPTRVKLLGCIVKCGRACSVGEIAECCSVDLSVVSRHLRQLERAGILESSKDGRTVSYSVRHRQLCGNLRALADEIEGYCRPERAGACSGACRAKS